FAGEAVAVVVGETLHAAKDGAERLEIDYGVLPAVVETAAAARQGAPRGPDEGGSGGGAPRGAGSKGGLGSHNGHCGGDGSSLRARRARDAVRNLGAARHRRADGAARGTRAIRSGKRTRDTLCRQWRRGAAEKRSRHNSRSAARKNPRADERYRRQF